MGDRLRLAVGVLGNAATLLLFAAPILTFARVIRKRSTEEFSCVPYIVTFANCVVYSWYGMPVVSYKWENFPLVTINGLGALFEISFIIIYFRFATSKGKIRVAATLAPILVYVVVIILVSSFAFHDHHHRKLFTGTIGLLASVGMYGSPLVVMKQVIRTKSVEFMPFYLSFFSLIASTLWLAYGLLSHDLLIASPNFLGVPFGMAQLVLYFMYKKKGVAEEPKNWDLEKNNEDKSKQLQLAVDENTNTNGKELN